MLSEEEYYLTATKEAEGEERNEALWAKSLALCEGDKEKAKYKYIHLRVEQLKNVLPNHSAPKNPEPTLIIGSLEKPTTESTAKVVYILYLVGIVIGITGIIGLIMAYVNRADAPDWLKTHYQLQIRTFWIGSIFGLICFWLFNMNSNQFLGIPVLLFWLVWLILRCTKGMKFLGKKEAYPNPESWLF